MAKETPDYRTELIRLAQAVIDAAATQPRPQPALTAAAEALQLHLDRGAGRPSRITLAMIEAAREAGYVTNRAIAKYLGCHENTVGVLLRRRSREKH